MFLRLLGRIFLYLYILPATANVLKRIVFPAFRKSALKLLVELENEKKKAMAQSRRNHPAGSRQR